MANWSMNNLACKTTWATLRTLGQFDKVFSEAGSLQIKELTFYNHTSSTGQRAAMARMLAIQLDNIFREFWSARYEDGVVGDQAIGTMAEVLTSADATVAKLAEECDKKYKFYGEEEE